MYLHMETYLTIQYVTYLIIQSRMHLEQLHLYLLSYIIATYAT